MRQVLNFCGYFIHRAKVMARSVVASATINVYCHTWSMNSCLYSLKLSSNWLTKQSLSSS